jgi:hypothetical protein
MKPDWDKLIKEYADSTTALVADVDCTEAGKDLCETHGVEGFPTIKYGDPSDLQDFEGEREFSALQKFAKENLKPMCSVKNLDLCDDAKKALIKKYQAMDGSALNDLIIEKETEEKEASKNFDEEVEKLQKRYEELEKEKKDQLAAIKDSGLGLMKAVRASLGASKGEL